MIQQYSFRLGKPEVFSVVQDYTQCIVTVKGNAVLDNSHS